MIRFTRRQYGSVLRRGGVPEPGLSYDDTARLVALLDDFREQQPEALRPHAYAYGNVVAVAAQFGTYELVAPPGGLYVRHIKQQGCAGTWWWGTLDSSATTIATPAGAQPTIRNIQTVPAQALPRIGSAVVVASTIMWGPIATGVEEHEFQWPGLYIPPGHQFFMTNATANDLNAFLVRWVEPGE